MKTELKSTKKNLLIGRREVIFEIQETATPNRSEVRREIAVMLKTELDNVWVKRQETLTGTHRTVGLAHVYDNPETALRVEPEHIILRNRTPEKETEREE